MKKQRILLLLPLIMYLAACTTPEWGHLQEFPLLATSNQDKAAIQTPLPTTDPTRTPGVTAESATPSLPMAETKTPLADSSPTPTLAPDAWKGLPVVPVVSAHMIDVYKAGLTAGRDPAHFSKIGDCQNITTYFLASFDNPKLYRLGAQYAFLQPTIDHFAGSWSRQSLAVKGGLNVAAALNPIWADPKQCKSGETPIACEIRVFNPSIVTVSMEESWSGDLAHYDMYLRRIVEFILSQNILPILATRAEVPGNKNSINEIVARVAYDYQVPLWNFGVAALPLPSYGLTGDGFHLTLAGNFFDDPGNMKEGWPWRNLTALEAIDAVYRAMSVQP